MSFRALIQVTLNVGLIKPRRGFARSRASKNWEWARIERGLPGLFRLEGILPWEDESPRGSISKTRILPFGVD